MRLRVSEFSSIKQADLEFNQVVLIVGPQASGKSILCKLSHFFLGLPDDLLVSVSDGESYDTFVDSTRNRFLQSFPLESWGSKKFEISFVAGDYEAKITRTEYKGKLGQRFRIWFSDSFKTFHKDLEERYKNLSSRGGKAAGLPVPLYDMRGTATRLKTLLMGSDYKESQLFIPAGRSFFTSVGHAIAIFERGSTLDPLTITFGRLFRTQLDYITRRRVSRIQSPISRMSADLLGGQISGSRNAEHLEMSDGRKIPLALLSSGQQELLPLITVIPTGFFYDERSLVYIEEPEAHLFPATQSTLVQQLVGFVSGSKNRTTLVITTHSPYVLAKFNNLVKAGAIGRGRFRSRVNEIIPQEAWLLPNRLTAYAIIDGTLTKISEADGLINGDYLDDVSGEIGKQFEALLDIETPVNA